jgi:hypothetical protein
MLDAAHEAVAFTQGRVREDLDADRMLTLSLVKEIEIIGEAANQVSETTREQLPGFPGQTSPECAIGWFTSISTSTWIFSGEPRNTTCRL